MYFRTTLSLIVLATLSLGLDAQVQFGAETTLATVAGIDSVDSQSADLNGDGLLDVVVLNQDLGISPQWISVFPADGTGDLGPRVDIPFSLNLPWKLAIGDFNEDGNQDIVVCDVLASSVTYLEGDGALGFTETSLFLFGLGGGVLDLKVVDIDDDTHLDLLVADFFSSSVSIFPGVGDGSFDFGINLPGVGFPMSVCSGDFNGDNILDVACGYNQGGGGGVSVFLANAPGDFAPEVFYQTTTSAILNIEARDVDGDNILDLVGPNENGEGVFVQTGFGDGTFGVGTTVSTGSAITSSRLADIDGDSKLDILARDGTFLHVLQGDGAGNFTSVAQLNNDWSGSAQTLAIDIDGDNLPELVTPNYDESISFYWNLTTPAVTPSLFTRGDANLDGGFDISDAIFTLSFLFGSGSTPPGCADSADSNDDGGTDISDAIFTLSTLFVVGSPSPPAPHPGCGEDPTDDGLDCADDSICQP